MCDRLIAIILALVVCSCTPIERKLFDFPITSTDFPEESVCLTPSLLSDLEFPVASNFRVTDSVLVLYGIAKDYGLTAFNLHSGDTLVNLCRKGRGPDEMILIAPFYNIIDGVASVVDPMTSKYMEVDIRESINAGVTNVRRHLSLGDAASPVYYQNIRMVGKDSLLCYDTKTNLETKSLSDVPSFLLYDLADGVLVSDYSIADRSMLKIKKSSVPLKELLIFRDCQVPGRDEICFGLARIPVIVFFDYKSGSYRGVKVNGVPAYDPKCSRYYFGHMYSDGDYVYTMYYGDVADQVEIDFSTILKLDLEGNIVGRYDLDDVYYQFDVNNGTMYLAKESDASHLYFLDMNNL